MITVDIKFDKVDIDVNRKSIQRLGEDNGISMYIIRTLQSIRTLRSVFKGGIKDDALQFEQADEIKTRVLKIDKAQSGWIATIDEQLYYLFGQMKIIEICKLNFT